jgi:hypothetical protein
MGESAAERRMLISSDATVNEPASVDMSMLAAMNAGMDKASENVNKSAV